MAVDQVVTQNVAADSVFPDKLKQTEANTETRVNEAYPDIQEGNFATKSDEILTRPPVSPAKLKPSVANTETRDTETSPETQNHSFATKADEILARKAVELVNHFYLRYHDRIPQDNDAATGEDSSCEDVTELDLELDFEYELVKSSTHKKTRSYCRAKRTRTPHKEKKFQEFCRKNNEAPENIVLGKTSKKSIVVAFSRCSKEMSKNSNRKEQTQRRKVNIEEKLRKLGLKRRRDLKNTTTDGGQRSNKTEQFEVNETNVPKEMEDLLGFLMCLQDREVTPEDYEFLLKLDELIPKKGLPEDTIQRLKKDVADDAHVEELCGVCMEPYKREDELTFLPCGHPFHSNCIKEWLKESTTCPMDGLGL